MRICTVESEELRIAAKAGVGGFGIAVFIGAVAVFAIGLDSGIFQCAYSFG